MLYRSKPRWTKAQLDYIRNNYATMKDEEMAFHLGKSLKAVRRQRENIKLKKVHGRGLVGPADGSSPVIDYNKQKIDIDEVIKQRQRDIPIGPVTNDAGLPDGDELPGE